MSQDPGPAVPPLPDFASKPAQHRYDAVVVGSGPNGLASAITIAQAGRSVLVLEAADRIGGGTRSESLTLPGFLHDVCSAIHALGVLSPFFESLPREDLGLSWILPSAPLAHPFDDGPAAMLEGSLDATAERLDADGNGYRRLFGPLVEHGSAIMDQIFHPTQIPRHPIVLSRFGLRAIRSARGLAESWFQGDRARGLFAGLAAHSVLPLEQTATGAFGLMLGLTGHLGGWPVARGGSQAIANAMARQLLALGGEIVVGRRVGTLEDCPESRAVLLDVTPRQLLDIAGHALPEGYRKTLARYQYGPGSFKLDWALDGPIPWKDPECARASTVHLGGTFNEVSASERDAWEGRHSERPFVLVAQQSLFDDSRAPTGKHTAWAYCHVPHGSTVDMTDRIEGQMERFAPGFKDRVLARHILAPADFQRHNENLIGGDISGGAANLRQLLARPALRIVPWATPAPNLFLCSSSTPPGPGVHGVCGVLAARAALRSVLR
ncbi:NAD(P)/FAD-dependent oxidoreductase [soil metagenome]